MNHLQFSVLRVQTQTMKNLISTLIISIFTLTTVLASNNPMTVLSNEIEVETINIMNSSSYESAEENLVFTTEANISVIQIFNEEGALEFQLPVMSNQVKLNKNLFEEGTYQLGFLIEGDSQVHLSRVNINCLLYTSPSPRDRG